MAKPNGFRLRAMRSNDGVAVAEMQSKLDPSSWSVSQWLQARKQCPAAWVAEVDGNLAAYIIYQTRVAQAELLNLGVSPAFQSKGVGSELLGTTMKRLPNRTECLYLEVRRSNMPAIGLYNKMGFSLVGERRDYYPVTDGTREDALVYQYDFTVAS